MAEVITNDCNLPISIKIEEEGSAAKQSTAESFERSSALEDLPIWISIRTLKVSPVSDLGFGSAGFSAEHTGYPAASILRSA
jgi:hypothetical protein